MSNNFPLLRYEVHVSEDVKDFALIAIAIDCIDCNNKPLTSNASLTIVGEVNRLRIHTTPNYIKKIQK